MMGAHVCHDLSTREDLGPELLFELVEDLQVVLAVMILEVPSLPAHLFIIAHLHVGELWMLATRSAVQIDGIYRCDQSSRHVLSQMIR
jgi:hypothetical protein